MPANAISRSFLAVLLMSHPFVAACSTASTADAPSNAVVPDDQNDHDDDGADGGAKEDGSTEDDASTTKDSGAPDATPSTPKPGDVDHTFGNGGTAVIAEQFIGVHAMVASKSGEVIVGGQVGADPVLVGFTSAGTANTGFGTNGERRLDAKALFSVSAISIRNDGSLLLGMTTRSNTTQGFGFAKTSATGVLTTSFGTSGYASGRATDYPNVDRFIVREVKELADGRFWAGGVVRPANGSSTLSQIAAVATFNASGSLVGSDIAVLNGSAYSPNFFAFGIDDQNAVRGIFTMRRPETTDDVYSLLFGPPSTGGSFGTRTSDLYGTPSAAVAHPSGGFVVFGRLRNTKGLAPQTNFLAKIAPNLLQDGAFASGGLLDVNVAFPRCDQQSVALATDSKGRIIVAHSGCTPTGKLTRWLPKGTLDTSFGKSGVVDTGTSRIYNVAIDGSDRIVTYESGNNIRRYVP